MVIKKHTKHITRYVIPVLLIILLLAVGLRMWGITSESYWLDESISITQAQAEYSQTLEMVKNDIHLPLYESLLHFWVKLFGISELSSRSLSMIFGVLSVGMTFLLARRLFSDEIAIVSALLMCLSPIMIYYSQEARLYSLFVFLTLVSFYLFINYLEKKSRANLIAYVFFSLLFIYTQLFAFLILLIQNIYVIYLNRSDIMHGFRIKPMLDWFIGQFVLLALFIPWLPTLLIQLARTGGGINWIPKPNAGTLLATLYDFLGNYMVLSIFVVLVIVFILAKRYKAIDKDKFILLSLWIFLPVLLVFTYSVIFSSMYLTRYMLFILPAIYVLFAVMICGLMPKKKSFRFIPLAIVCILMISSFISVVGQVNRKDKDDWRSASDYIKQNVKEGDVVFIDPFYEQNPFTYYYDRYCFNESYVNSCNFNRHKILSMNWMAKCCNDTTLLTATYGKNTLGSYLDNNIWLISVRPELNDGNTSLFDYFNSRKRLISSEDIGGTSVIKIYRFG